MPEVDITVRLSDAEVNFHPAYLYLQPDWEQMRDTSAGEREVKAQETTYLPKTEGQELDPNRGADRYAKYLLRAVYANYLGDTQKSMLGLMHSEPPTISVPSRIDDMLTDCTVDGKSADMQLRRINENQLIYSRYGMLLDPPTEQASNVYPRIASYGAFAILNWYAPLENGETVLRYVLLDESAYEFNLESGEWEHKLVFRVLGLDAKDEYFTAVFTDSMGNVNLADPGQGDNIVYPEISKKRLNFIPFTFVNGLSIGSDPEKPSLIPLSDLCLAIYRGSADYRQALFMQGQDTLTATGVSKEDGPWQMGSGNALVSESKDAKFAFIGVTGDGIEEMRESQNDLKAQAISVGVALIDTKSSESGEALKTRLGIKTASMQAFALTGAEGLREQLRWAAEWTSSNPEEVEVVPNTDFTEGTATAQDALQLWTTLLQGAPLSIESYHDWMARNDFTRLTFEQEAEKIDEQPTLGLSE